MKLNFKKYFHKTGRLVRGMLIVSGTIMLILVVYAFTSGPFWLYYHLGAKNTDFNFSPDYIILLGGSGMPSESNLIRAYYASKIGREYLSAPLIVALTGNTADTTSAVVQLAGELVYRGIKGDRIFYEPDGINTRSQVLNIAGMFPNRLDNVKIVVVTSPEHMRRSLLCFRKAGFANIGGYPAFEYAIESDITTSKDDFGGNKFIPDVNNSISLRYRFWVHLKYEVAVIREYFALAYYKLKGWI